MSEDPRAYGEQMADALLTDNERLDAITQALALISSLITVQTRLAHNLSDLSMKLALDRDARAFFKP